MLTSCEKTWRDTLLQSFVRNVNNVKRHSGNFERSSVWDNVGLKGDYQLMKLHIS